MSSAHGKLVTDTGGIIGVWPAGAMFRNMDLWASYIAQLVVNVGADHVAIGTDMEGGIDGVFNDYAAYPKVVEALLSKGLSAADAIKIVGGNHARVFKAVAAAAAA